MDKTCEITEAKDEKPPFPRKGHSKAVEADINKLFEAVNISLTKSLDLPDTRRNPSKQPMRTTNGPNSPRIGFSEPVSLKQALRGLCLSQASEMAALKRSSLPASPRISETGKISNIYKLVESGESGCSPLVGQGRKIEVSLVVEENRLNSLHVVKSATQSYSASPRFGVKPNSEKLENNSRESSGPLAECSTSDVGISVVEREVSKCSSNELPLCVLETNTVSVKSSIVHKEIDNEPEIDVNVVGKGLEKEDRSFESPLPHNQACDSVSNQEKNYPGSSKLASVSSKKPGSSLKSRRKPQSSSGVENVKKDRKISARSTTGAVKPVILNKSLIIKKLKKAASPKDGNLKAAHRVNSSNEDNSGALLCHKCQSSLSNTGKDSRITNTSVVKNNKNQELAENRDMSSKSSACDFSTSTTTSLSDDSNLSWLACGNRPHMSRDVRWGAINHVRKQNGFLGLSHFNLLKKLGSGDIGTVYLAELAGTGCPFAIKVMDNEFLARRKKMVRAQTEREILGMLDHPFLPTLYGQFTSDNLSCLIMEFCPGGDLHVLRQKQPGRCFSEDATRFYVAEVLLALEYLHMLGIIYRDLKPENILVCEDGHIMLTDFDLSLRCHVTPTVVPSSSPPPPDPHRPSGPSSGSSCIDPFCSRPISQVSCFGPRARRPQPNTEAHCTLPQLVAEPTGARSNSFVGTHEYLAPEIIKGEGHGSSVDWWTLGVFLYELLYGRTPFKGSDNEETLANVVVREVRFPDWPIVGFCARDLIRRLLVKEAEGRLGAGMGAAEIKRHQFFKGINWALVRCGAPPLVPADDRESEGSFHGGGDHLGFELF